MGSTGGRASVKMGPGIALWGRAGLLLGRSEGAPFVWPLGSALVGPAALRRRRPVRVGPSLHGEGYCTGDHCTGTLRSAHLDELPLQCPLQLNLLNCGFAMVGRRGQPNLDELPLQTIAASIRSIAVTIADHCSHFQGVSLRSAQWRLQWTLQWTQWTLQWTQWTLGSKGHFSFAIVTAMVCNGHSTGLPGLHW